MNAIEFVRKHGWEAVIEAVKSTNAEETAGFESKDLDPILAKDGDIVGFNVKIYQIPYIEVESLVKSWELVQGLGGFTRAKKTFISSDKSLGYTHVYLHENNRYCFLDDYVDYIPEQAISFKSAIKAISDVEIVEGTYES